MGSSKENTKHKVDEWVEYMKAKYFVKDGSEEEQFLKEMAEEIKERAKSEAWFWFIVMILGYSPLLIGFFVMLYALYRLDNLYSPYFEKAEEKFALWKLIKDGGVKNE
ncbi:hypothetical protein A3L12_03600 [Thermococcus sp. P6]|uniref:hypothetical protein n=1 Tax=Thermococcus sp. P6 TaxID=122420 RepID=UPI000B59AB61|nr:hypothetical protein [Thermococcus sp. P6]ASJ10448.1 hypothetical protein A3L12_03600 [Thermococcus sp. P6]